MTDRTLTVRLRAIGDQYEKVLASAAKRTDEMAASTNRLIANNKKVTEIGGKMTRNITVPVLAGGAAVVHFAGDYEAAMREVQALTGATASEMEMMSGQAKKMGQDTQFSAEQAAQTMVQLIKGGFTARQAYDALPGVMQLAAAAGLDIATAADIATNALSGFGMEVGELARVNDVLSAAADNSDTDVLELGEALKMVGPIAKAQNVSLEETSAILALLAKNGIRGTMAGTALRGMMGALLAPSGEAASVLERLGVSVLDAHGNLLPMTELIDRFTKAGATSADIYQVFGRETAGAFQALLGTGAPALEKMSTLLEESEGHAQNMADAKMGGLSGSIEQLRGSVEGLVIAMGEAGASDFISALAGGATELANALGSADPMVLKIGMSIALLAAASGPAIWAAGKMASGVQAFIGKLQAVQVQLALARMEGLSTGSALMASFGPQAAVLVGVAALAGVLYLAKKQADAFAASHIAAGDAAMTLAKSAGLATKEIGALDAATEHAIVTSDDYRRANEDAIQSLRAMDSADLQDAFLIQLGYELVLRGATPEEAFKEIGRLAEISGVEVPVSMTVVNIDDFNTQVEAAATEAKAIADRLANDNSGNKDRIGPTSKAELDRIAESAANAFNTQGIAAYAEILAAAEGELGSTSAAMNYLTDTSMRLTEVQGLSERKANNTRDALLEMGSSASSAGQDNRDASAKILELVKTMDGGLTPANLRAAAAQVNGAASASDYAAAAAEAEAATSGAGDAALEATTSTDAFAASLDLAAGRAKLAALDIEASASAASAFSKSIENSSNIDNQMSAGLGLGSALNDIRKGLFGEGDAAEQAATKTKKASDAVDRLGDAVTRTDPKLDAMHIRLGSLSAAADGFRQSIADSTGMDNQIDAALDVGEAFSSFRRAVKKLPEDIDLAAASLGRYKPRQRDAIRDVTKLGASTTEYLASLLAAGRGSAAVRVEAGRLREEYAAQMRAAGLSEQAIGKYIEILGLTPKQVETAIKVSGVEAARFEINAFLQLLDGRIPPELATSVTAQINSGDLDGASQSLAAWAATNPQKITVEPEVDTAGAASAADKMVLPKDFDPLAAALGWYSEAETAGIEALQRLGDATTEYLASIIGSGEPEKAREQADLLRQSYVDQLAALGLNAEQIQKYLDLLGLTPEQVETAIVVSGEEEARFKIETYTALLGEEIPPEVSTEVLTLIDQGRLAEAAAALQAWRESEASKPITVPVYTSEQWSAYGGGAARTGASPATPTLPSGQADKRLSPAAGYKIGLGDKVSDLNGNATKDSLGRTWKWDAGQQLWLAQFASGGSVPSYGRGVGDSVPAKLSPREFVVRAGPATAHRSTLEAINAGKSIPGTAMSASAMMSPVTSAGPALDDRSLGKLAAMMPTGSADSYDVKIVSPNPRRAAEDLVRSTGSAKWVKTGRKPS